MCICLFACLFVCVFVCPSHYSKCIKNFAKFVLPLKIGEEPDKCNVQLNQVIQIIWSDSFFRRVVFVKFSPIFRVLGINVVFCPWKKLQITKPLKFRPCGRPNCILHTWGPKRKNEKKWVFGLQFFSTFFDLFVHNYGISRFFAVFKMHLRESAPAIFRETPLTCSTMVYNKLVEYQLQYSFLHRLPWRVNIAEKLKFPLWEKSIFLQVWKSISVQVLWQFSEKLHPMKVLQDTTNW